MCLTPLNSTMLNHSMRRKETCSYLERKIASTACWGICHLNQHTLSNMSTAQTAQHKSSMYRYTAHTEHAVQPPRCLLSYCLQEEKWFQAKWNDLNTIMFNMVAQVKHMGGWGGACSAEVIVFQYASVHHCQPPLKVMKHTEHCSECDRLSIIK